MNANLKAPFPYFGGKSLVTETVWSAFGDVKNYVEPFAGSLAVLLARPTPVRGPETINDYSCHLVNAWRAIANAPEQLADACVAPVSEVNTEAQHYALVRDEDSLRDRLGDPHYFDIEKATWWIKGACEWIGGGWASGEGPWQWSREHGWQKKRNAGTGVNRQLPHLGNAGRGVNRQLPHLGDAGTGERQLRVEWLTGWFAALADRLSGIRMACGDWKRVTGPSVAYKHGTTAVFLDPPYDSTEYVYGKTINVSEDVREWCAESGANPKLRIILCGRGSEHDSLLDLGWRAEGWKTRKGYSKEGNASEKLWLSPACLDLSVTNHGDLFSTRKGAA